ncbi:MAG: TetR/AcrR family transcriptional regulator [Thermotogota bacterium]
MIKIKKAFKKISDEKRKHIINKALEEFSQKGFEKASLNRIIKRSNISKGGMYKYFESKESLYEYVVDKSVKEVLDSVEKIKEYKHKGIKDLLIKYGELEFDFYINNPIKYELFNKVFFQKSTEIDKKILNNYLKISDNYFFEELKKYININLIEKYNLINWVIKGVLDNYIIENKNKNDPQKMKEEFIKNLKKYLDMIKID